MSRSKHHGSLSRQATVILFIVVVMPGATGCYQAFYPVEREAVSQENHDPYFPINQGAHASQDCDQCHGEFASFAQFTCLSCHEHSCTLMDPAHDELSDYSCDSPSCLRCHPRGEIEDDE